MKHSFWESHDLEINHISIVKMNWWNMTLKMWKLTFGRYMVHSNSDSKYDKTTACAWMDDGWHKFLQARENILHVKPDTDTQKANVEPYTAPIYLAKFL